GDVERERASVKGQSTAAATGAVLHHEAALGVTCDHQPETRHRGVPVDCAVLAGFGGGIEDESGGEPVTHRQLLPWVSSGEAGATDITGNRRKQAEAKRSDKCWISRHFWKQTEISGNLG